MLPMRLTLLPMAHKQKRVAFLKYSPLSIVGEGDGVGFHLNDFTEIIRKRSPFKTKQAQAALQPEPGHLNF